MPLYEYQCEEGHVTEHLYKHGEVPDELECICGYPAHRLLSMPAKTATLWSGSWASGLGGSGFYSQSVGSMVGSKREEEKIMNKRGFVREADLAGGGEIAYERSVSKKNEERAKMDKMADTYQSNLKKFNGDKIQAVTETFPAHEMLKE